MRVIPFGVKPATVTTSVEQVIAATNIRFRPTVSARFPKGRTKAPLVNLVSMR